MLAVASTSEDSVGPSAADGYEHAMMGSAPMSAMSESMIDR